MPTDADADETTDLLEEHAEESQGNVLEYAADADGIEIRNRFWVTNAVLLEVDADRVDLETFDRFRNVTAIHENFEVSVPDEPESAPSSSTDRVERRGYETAPGVADVGAPAVWDAYDTRGEGVKIAVLDTGVDGDAARLRNSRAVALDRRRALARRGRGGALRNGRSIDHSGRD